MIVFGCSAQKVPDGFPSKLVDFELKLLHEGKPVVGAAVVFDNRSNYSVFGFTGTDGVVTPSTSINTYTKSGIPPADYKIVITYTPKVPSELSNDQLSKMTMEEVTAYRAKVAAEVAAMPNIVPDNWGNSETTPVKITVPESGGKTTLEITAQK
jgi:hypothetical protein